STRRHAQAAAGVAAASQRAADTRRGRNRSYPEARRSQDRADPSGYAGENLGLTNATRFINLLEVAGISRTQRETGGAAGTGGGFEGDFQIPVFDFGEARVRRAGEIYFGAVNPLSELSVNARAGAREGYRAYRAS